MDRNRPRLRGILWRLSTRLNCTRFYGSCCARIFCSLNTIRAAGGGCGP